MTGHGGQPTGPKLASIGSIMGTSGGQLDVGAAVDRYEIVRLIGSGAMGEVYLAVHGFTKKAVALKVLRAGQAQGAEQMRTEAMALCRVHHDHLVEVYDAGLAEVAQPDGSRPSLIWMAMELLEGESLRERIHREGAVRPGLALSWAAAVAEGLEAAHAEGIVHRDLKPENVFLTKAGDVRVLDFGTVGMKGQVDAAAQGTVAYMAPEQLGREPVDARADVYALGILLYEMLAGRHPFSNPEGGLGTTEQLVAMQLTADPEPLEAFVGREVWSVVARAVDKVPDRRFGSMTEMGAALRGLARAYGGRAGALRLSGSGSELTPPPMMQTPAPMGATPVPPHVPAGVTGKALAGLALVATAVGALAVVALRPPPVELEPKSPGVVVLPSDASTASGDAAVPEGVATPSPAVDPEPSAAPEETAEPTSTAEPVVVPTATVIRPRPKCKEIFGCPD